MFDVYIKQDLMIGLQTPRGLSGCIMLYFNDQRLLIILSRVDIKFRLVVLEMS
jgi:hypothetical protein